MTGLLDRMILTLSAQSLELEATIVLVGDETLREGPVLNIGENLLHCFLHLRANNTRAGHIVAVFGGVGARPALLRQTTLVDEVNNELEFVANLEVGHLRHVPGLGEGLVAVLDEARNAATQDRLLAEEISFGLLGEGRFDDAGASRTNALRVGQGEGERLT